MTAVIDNAPAAAPAAYDRVTIVLHWLTAALVLAQWSGAIAMGLIDERPVRLVYWTIHIGLGTILFLVLLGRIFWRYRSGLVLPPVSGDPMQMVVGMAHKLLYALLFVLILLGFVILALRGWHLLGLFTITPVVEGYRPLSTTLISVHKWTAHVLMAVAFGHALVALYHHWVLKDGVLGRMTSFGRGM
jgi:cytochrome b561